jgi:hypothetical protein
MTGWVCVSFGLSIYPIQLFLHENKPENFARETPSHHYRERRLEPEALVADLIHKGRFTIDFRISNATVRTKKKAGLTV